MERKLFLQKPGLGDLTLQKLETWLKTSSNPVLEDIR